MHEYHVIRMRTCLITKTSKQTVHIYYVHVQQRNMQNANKLNIKQNLQS